MLAAVDLKGVGEAALSWAAVAVLGGVAALVLRLTTASARGSIFPRQRVRLAPWRLTDLLLVALAYFGINTLLVRLLDLHGADLVLGTELRLQTHSAVAAGLPGGVAGHLGLFSAAYAAEMLDQADQAFRQVCGAALGRPLQVAAIILILIYVSGGRLYQLGITIHGLPKVLVASYLVWLVVSVVAFVIFIVVKQFDPPAPHPFETLLRFHGSLLPWSLVLFAVLIAAPVGEELLFRGILQPIMVRSPEVADLTILVALVGIIVRGTAEALGRGSLSSVWPIVILVSTGGGYLGFERIMWRWLPRPGAARAIFASSILFAALHAAVWPTPIPLFFLSLGLGYLGYRTQSLIGPIVVHSLFNLVTVGTLLQG